MKIIRSYTRLSQSDTGRLVANYDHATVHHACKTIDNLNLFRDKLDFYTSMLEHVCKGISKARRKWLHNKIAKRKSELYYLKSMVAIPQL